MAKQKNKDSNVKKLVEPHLNDFLDLLNSQLQKTGLDKDFNIDQVRFKLIAPLSAGCREVRVCRKFTDPNGNVFVKCVNETVCT